MYNMKYLDYFEIFKIILPSLFSKKPNFLVTITRDSRQVGILHEYAFITKQK